jgi:hypothetical protein
MELIKTTLAVELELEDYENFAIACGWTEHIPQMNEKNVAEMVENPVSKLDFAKQALHNLLKEAIYQVFEKGEQVRNMHRMKTYKKAMYSRLDESVLPVENEKE